MNCGTTLPSSSSLNASRFINTVPAMPKMQLCETIFTWLYFYPLLLITRIEDSVEIPNRRCAHSLSASQVCPIATSQALPASPKTLSPTAHVERKALTTPCYAPGSRLTTYDELKNSDVQPPTGLSLSRFVKVKTGMLACPIALHLPSMDFMSAITVHMRFSASGKTRDRSE